MGSFSNNMARLASRMITKFGETQEITFTRSLKGQYSPLSLTHEGNDTLTYTTVAAPVEFKTSEIDGEIITRDMLKLFITGTLVANEDDSDVTPLKGDQLTIVDINYKVIDVKAYRTQSVTCAYELTIGI